QGIVGGDRALARVDRGLARVDVRAPGRGGRDIAAVGSGRGGAGVRGRGPRGRAGGRGARVGGEGVHAVGVVGRRGVGGGEVVDVGELELLAGGLGDLAGEDLDAGGGAEQLLGVELEGGSLHRVVDGRRELELATGLVEGVGLLLHEL